MLNDVLKRLESDEPAALDRLNDILRIPSVSTDPTNADDCRKAAGWFVDQLRECGLSAEAHETGGHPVVIGRYDGAGDEAPRILFYGHYDVQPPDPLDKWTTPPFEPTVRDGKIYARGSADDKGQVMTFVESLRAWNETARSFPINLTVMIEGEEECGSEHLDAWIDANVTDLAADVAVVSDTSMWGPGQPAVTYALRGLLYFDIKLFGPSRDLHSGVYGGTIANPANELVKVIGRLFDDDHRVTVPGFYDDVVAIDDAELAAWDALGFDENEWAQSVGMDAVHGIADCTTLQRRWAQPSCDVNGIYGGYEGEGAKTVIPSFAGCKVSFRLAANQDPPKIDAAFRAWLDERTPPGCRWKLEHHGAATPVILPTDSPYIAAAQRAIESGCGKPAVLVREGATIPVGATFKEKLGLDTLFIGFGLNDDNLHSPNEKFDLANFRMGCRTHAALLSALAE